MIAIVVAESLVGFTCPFTTWENQLRIAAGAQGYERSFIGEILHSMLFYECRPVVFTISYSIFGALVAGLYLIFPPNLMKRFWKKSDEERKAES